MTPEQEQLLAYLCAKTAKLDAMLSVALPALVVASEILKKEKESAETKKTELILGIAAAQAYAEEHVRMTAVEIGFLSEQFPHLARHLKEILEISSRDQLRDIRQKQNEDGA